MARPSAFTDDEDTIIMSTAGLTSVETNRLLAEAGFTERTPDSIKSRRSYLSRTGNAQADGIVGLLSQRDKLQRQRDGIDLALEKVNKALLDELGSLSDELTDGHEG